MDNPLTRESVLEYMLRVCRYWAELHEQHLATFLESGAFANELMATQVPGFPQTYRVL